MIYMNLAVSELIPGLLDRMRFFFGYLESYLFSSQELFLWLIKENHYLKVLKL